MDALETAPVQGLRDDGLEKHRPEEQSLDETDAAFATWEGNLPRSIGPYRVVRVLGEGGMSTVFLAQQSEPIQRQVAIKLINRNVADPRVGHRFEAERQALARLQHPNVAQVFDAGVHAGHPYLVMEHVPGLPLDQYCDRHQLGLRSRLELFMTLCEAVQHAHQKALLHRDLKPANVLVMEEQGRPMLKVIDFGIVKSLAEPLSHDVMPTAHLVGTPAYLAPETVRAWQHGGGDPDTRVDIYALGMVLYQLLVGELPFDSASGLELLRSILDQEPPRPSARFAALSATEQTRLARRRASEPGALVRHLRGDLDWIVLKAIARERGDRYASAAELAADIVRHLRDEPVLAGPPSTRYQIGKFIRRHTGGVAAALLVVLALVGGIAGVAIQAERANREAEVSRRVSEFLIGLFKISNPSEARGRTITARELLDQGAEKIHQELAGEPRIQAQMMATIGTVYTELGLFSQAEPQLQGALAIRRREFGEESPEMADSLHRLGALYLESGRPDEGERLLQQELDLLQRLPDTDPLAVARTLNGLAAVKASSGRLAEAAPLLEQAAATFERVQGPDSTSLALTLNNLAGVHAGQGHFAEADALIRRSLAIRERVLGPDHPHVAFALVGLGDLLVAQGKTAEALPVLHRALGILERTQGPEHPDVAVVLGYLGAAWQQLHRHDEAEPLLRRSLTIQERALGADHVRLVVVLRRLAASCQVLGQVAEAERLEQRAAAIEAKGS